MTEQPDFFEEDPAAIEKAQRIAYLIAGYLRNSLTPAEHDELDTWVGENDTNMRIFEELTDESKLKEGVDFLSHIQLDKARRRIKAKLGMPEQATVRRFRINWQYAAAACFVLLAGISIYIYVRPKPVSTNHIAEIVQQNSDLQPGTDKAVLTLADGSTIVLDNSKTGTLATQGNTEVVNENGKLVYNGNGAAPEALMQNTVTTNRGNNFVLTLSDGTKVWLDAASSLTYPAAFTGKQRKVTVSGQAYFEVAKNKAMPFIVGIKDNDASVEVLGTHFNINAYSDEALVKTTLLEGSVKLSLASGATGKAATTLFLKPGQQAQSGDAGIKLKQDIDTEAVMAWKNGMFRFDNTDLRTIMKEVSRWYDVDIEFETSANPGYTSLLPRNIPASRLFKVLEENGGVHFKIDGKKVRVLP